MEKNSLWKNIRNKAKENKRTGATPKKPTTEMLKQESKIKANSKMMGGMLGGAKAGPTFKTNSGLGTAIAAGGLALAASKLFGGKGDVMPDVGKMKYGGKMKNC
jgi:predicted lipid-binding transport protein (Tim44 family)